MRTRNNSIKLLVAIAIAVVAIVSIWNARRVNALPAVDSFGGRFTFGMIHIVPGQTARLNVVNTPINPGRGSSVPINPGSIEGGHATEVTLTFFDRNGNQVMDANGQPVHSTATLNPGQSTFLELNGDSFAPPFTKPQPDSTCGGGGCTIIRPAVTASQQSSFQRSGKEQGQASLINSTLELIDNSTGKTTVLYAPGSLKIDWSGPGDE